MRTFIYVLQDIDGEIRYVGKTCHTLLSMFKQHLNESKHKKGNSHKNNWFRACIKKGYYPIMRCIEIIDDGDGNLQEMYWIDRYKKQGCNLTNITNGGEGVSGYKRTMPPWNKGLVMPEEFRKKISEAKMGQKWTK